MASPIPIQNIYYLLVYAWDKLPESNAIDVSKLESQELVDLFAAVLDSGIKHLLRRGLHQDYILHEEEIPGVRGRINVGKTVRRMLLQHGHAHCEFDELSVDTLPNQILISTVRRLLRSQKLDRQLRRNLRGLNRELGGISEIHLNKQLFRRVQLHSNNRFYRFLLNVCELAFDASLADEQPGSYSFQDFIREPRQMAMLFEAFVFNFVRTECPYLNVKKEKIAWCVENTNDSSLAYLPAMETDISVRSKQFDRTFIIDTKFYKDTFQEYYEKESIHSGHLYQLFAYLKNLETRGGADAVASGMLLYPVVDRSVQLIYEIQGHKVQICTLNLSADWQEIRDELLGLISSEFPEPLELVANG